MAASDDTAFEQCMTSMAREADEREEILAARAWPSPEEHARQVQAFMAEFREQLRTVPEPAVAAKRGS